MKLDEAYSITDKLLTEGKLILGPLASKISKMIDQNYSNEEIASTIMTLGANDGIVMTKAGNTVEVKLRIDGSRGNLIEDSLCIAIRERNKFAKVRNIISILYNKMLEAGIKKYPGASVLVVNNLGRVIKKSA